MQHARIHRDENARSRKYGDHFTKVCLAGYVGEKVKFNTTTTGVTSDFQKAMAIAHFMVWRIGMGPSGLVGDYLTIGDKNPFVLSEETKIRLNQDVDKIIKDCLAEVEALLRKEKELFERFAHELMTKKELDYDEIEAIFAEYGKVNPRQFQLTKIPEPPKV